MRFWTLLGALGAALRHRADFPVGSQVLIEGLHHEVELNGREAVVQGFDAQASRYVVRFVDSDLIRKVLPEHLQAKTACAGAGPGGLPAGSQALVKGMTSSAFMNGKKVSVRCFNAETQRYVVQLSDGTLRAVKAEHLSRAEVSASVEEVVQEPRLRPGSNAMLKGLRNEAMNGKVVRVTAYDESRQRYIVRLPDGALRKVQAEKLEATSKVQQPRLSLCSAWRRRLKVVLQSEASSKALGNLDFQACEDIQDLPFEKGQVSFLMGSEEVATAPFDLSQGRLQLTVAPSENKGRVHVTKLEEDGDAFFLHLIDGRGAERAATLSVQRGELTKVLPLDKTYRLERLEDMSLTLLDGAKRLKLAFLPEKAKTYSAIVTGGSGDGSERDGLVLHKLGEWTSAEQLAEES